MVLAKSSKEAIELVTSAVGEKELPVTYLLGEKYVAAMQALGQGDNAKTIVFPADIPAAIRGLMGQR